MGDCHIGVFGSGVVGLNTALELQKQIRNAKITIIADKFLEDTTSDKAAGIFIPADYFAGPTPQITQEWIDDSFHFYEGLKDEAGVGIKEISGYILAKSSWTATRNRFMEGLVPVFRTVDDDELASISPGDWKYGSYLKTYLVECRGFLPWAMHRFKQNGGQFVNGRIDSFSEVENFGKFDLIMNCTGLGARALCNDRRLTPMRGQVYKVSAPWLDKFYLAEHTTYIVPGIWAATLGGTKNYGSWDTSVSKYDSASIWDRCTRIVPKLSTAPVIKEIVGLRPHRDIVRVEPEIINGLKVVHHYGHGGYGVTSSPGSAKTATSMAINMLKGSKL
ncbi:D-aspartate oxidase [Halyomorpha halys]|uniref:D-aspartate oxidase n=1 Tax=Halyomorpha halys TaxID=286706 RepID=UPI0006D51D77|nr:D-aspartate oxidase-like [Halyomorpha halys]